MLLVLVIAVLGAVLAIIAGPTDFGLVRERVGGPHPPGARAGIFGQRRPRGDRRRSGAGPGRARRRHRRARQLQRGRRQGADDALRHRSAVAAALPRRRAPGGTERPGNLARPRPTAATSTSGRPERPRTPRRERTGRDGRRDDGGRGERRRRLPRPDGRALPARPRARAAARQRRPRRLRALRGDQRHAQSLRQPRRSPLRLAPTSTSALDPRTVRTFRDARELRLRRALDGDDRAHDRPDRAGGHTVSAVFSQLTIADIFPTLGNDDSLLAADIPLYGRANVRFAEDGTVRGRHRASRLRRRHHPLRRGARDRSPRRGDGEGALGRCPTSRWSSTLRPSTSARRAASSPATSRRRATRPIAATSSSSNRPARCSRRAIPASRR